MKQLSFFPELEIEEDPTPEIPDCIIPAKEESCKEKSNSSKLFITVMCARCSQKLIVPDNTKDDYIICADCDEKRRSQFDKFKNFALIKALRIHKYL